MGQQCCAPGGVRNQTQVDLLHPDQMDSDIMTRMNQAYDQTIPKEYAIPYNEPLKLSSIVQQALRKVQHFEDDPDLDEEFRHCISLPPHSIIKTQEVYHGQWFNGQRCGKGKLYAPDGTYYEGYWKNDMPNIRGVIVLPNGEIYQGCIENGMAHGYGVQHFQSGVVFEGDWLYNQQNGYGVERWPNGEVYSGCFIDGLKEGRGEFKWQNGAKYVGEFAEGKIQGNGQFTWPDNRIYEGQWEDGKMHGEGTMTWPNGKVFSGKFVEGLQEFGVLKRENGVTVKGYWKVSCDADTKSTNKNQEAAH